MVVKTIKKDDVKYENIDWIGKTISIKNKTYRLSDFVSELVSINKADILLQLKNELYFMLRLYGLNGYDIYNYLINIGFPKDLLS